MVYLVVFHWGWLAGALLLGFAMGWIAVVHRGRGVSNRTAQWLSVLADDVRYRMPVTVSAARRSAHACGSGPVRLLARTWTRDARGLSGGLRDRLVAAKPGGLAPGGVRLINGTLC